jgi:hypothetical protein
MLPGPYNNNYQIVQTPGYVMILVEQIHDVRIIRLDGRPHLPPSVRQWMGDSLGHWEGDTLVVDTTNFTHKTGELPEPDVALFWRRLNRSCIRRSSVGLPAVTHRCGLFHERVVS